MIEGNEENMDSAPLEEQPTPQHQPNTHTELELVFVLILIGLLGIAIFLYMNFHGTMKDLYPDKVVEVVVEETELVPVDFVSGSAEKIDHMGIVLDEAIGSYFTHPQTGKTLYAGSSECSGECLNDWTPHLAEEDYQDGDLSTTERDDGTIQYTWLGRALYTYNPDITFGDFLGDGATEGFSVARP